MYVCVYAIYMNPITRLEIWTKGPTLDARALKSVRAWGFGFLINSQSIAPTSLALYTYSCRSYFHNDPVNNEDKHSFLFNLRIIYYKYAIFVMPYIHFCSFQESGMEETAEAENYTRKVCTLTFLIQLYVINPTIIFTKRWLYCVYAIVITVIGDYPLTKCMYSEGSETYAFSFDAHSEIEVWKLCMYSYLVNRVLTPITGDGAVIISYLGYE